MYVGINDIYDQVPTYSLWYLLGVPGFWQFVMQIILFLWAWYILWNFHAHVEGGSIPNLGNSSSLFLYFRDFMKQTDAEAWILWGHSPVARCAGVGEAWGECRAMVRPWAET